MHPYSQRQRASAGAGVHVGSQVCLEAPFGRSVLRLSSGFTYITSACMLSACLMNHAVTATLICVSIFARRITAGPCRKGGQWKGGMPSKVVMRLHALAWCSMDGRELRFRAALMVQAQLGSGAAARLRPLAAVASASQFHAELPLHLPKLPSQDCDIDSHSPLQRQRQRFAPMLIKP